MSRKRKNKNQRSPVKYFTDQLTSVCLTVLTCVLNFLWSCCSPSSIMMMMMKQEEEKAHHHAPPQSKKEARLMNKQSKLMAEYRLLNNDHPETKKIKLDQQDNGGGGGGRKMLDPEEFKRVKKELAERKRILTQLPCFRLTTLGTDSSVFSTQYSTRTPLLLADIQHLITYAYGGNELIPPPSRWCTLQKPNRLVQLVVVLVEGLGLNEFVDNEHLLTRTMGLFGNGSLNRCIVEVLDPQWYGASVANEVARWGLFEIDEDDGGSSSKKDSLQIVIDQLSSVFAITRAPPTNNSSSGGGDKNDDKFPRTKLLLSLPQLIQEAYPLPIPSNPMLRDSAYKFVQTAREYAPVTRCSPMFAIDCEMCGAVGEPNALVKIAVVDEHLNTVYESLVRPKTKIVDYRTKWSGITPQMLQGVEVRLKDVQERIKQLVDLHPDCILVGQSLNCDLNSMRMIHPYVIDTSVCFNLTGIEGRKSKLKDLALNLLDEVIQEKQKNKEGHCPVEDAIAAMKLVKAKLANDITFGNAAKNSSIQPTVVSSEPVVETLNQYFKEKRNTLDKNVLVITTVSSSQHHQQSSEEEDGEEERETKEKLSLPLLYHKINNKPPSQEKSKITVKESPSNRATMKMLNAHLYDNHMSIAHYRINKTKSLSKEIIKLDKRVQKLMNKMCDNSMVVLVCSKENNGGGGDVKKTEDDNEEHSSRRNNGVCLVRVKVNDGGLKRRRDD